MLDGQPLRKQMRRRDIPGSVRYITFSCYGRMPLLNHPEIRELFIDALGRARRTFAFELFAWVVMPEHAHLLLRPKPGDALAPALAFMKTSTSQRILNRWKRLRAPILHRLVRAGGGFHYWLPGGGFDRNVRDEPEFCETVRYIHRNPVERGLVAAPDGWRWSSIHSWLGRPINLIHDAPPWGLNWHTWDGFQ